MTLPLRKGVDLTYREEVVAQYATDEELVFNYVGSYSQTAKEIISIEKELFLERVCSKKNTDGYMYIHKPTGNVVCEPF